MSETIQDLTDAKVIAEHVCRMLTESMQYPDFGYGGVPVPIAAQVFGKDACWVRQGIIDGWLPIGKARPSDSGKKTNFYISPKLLWELTGYVWKGEL